MRVFVVSRQGTVAKAEAKVHEGHRDQDQRVPERISGERESAADGSPPAGNAVCAVLGSCHFVITIVARFQQICKMTPRFTIGDCAGGHRGDNREKNRDVLIVPR